MTFTISILIKSTIILLLTTAAVLALKKSSASLRHLVISLGLFGLILLPAFQYFTPMIEVEMPIVEQLELETIPFVWNETLPGIDPIENIEKESPEFIQQDVYASNVELDPPVIEAQKGIAFFQLDMDWKATLFWIWISGCVLFLMRVVVQMIRIWSINRSSEPISISLKELGINLEWKVIFSTSADIKTPMTFGLFQAKILLPTDAQNWSSEQLKIVLLHELAHIKRYDYLLHLIGLLTLSLFWFHPLVWLLQKWQQSEREKACDEYVLKQGISKTNYAESLVNIARNMLNKKTHRWHSSLPMAASSETKKRVLAILKFDLQQWRFTRWMQWRWIGFFACVLPLLAAIHPAAKELVEESIPKIEAVLEQPVFVPKTIEKEEVTIALIPKSEAKNLEKVSSVRDSVIIQLSSLPLQKITTQSPIQTSLPKQKVVLGRDEEEAFFPFSQYYISPDESVKIWTKGTFKIQDEYPYFTDLSDYAIIIIEVKDASGKANQLVVKKYNYNGWVTKNLSKSDIGVKEGETVFTWVGNKRRKATTVQHLDSKSVGFLANQASGVHGKWQTWMVENIGAIAKKMRDFDDEDVWETVEKSDSKEEWHQVVEECLRNSFFYWIDPASSLDYDKMIAEKNAFRFRISHEELENKRTDALYGKWEEEDKEIEVWTKGEYNLVNKFPYFKDLSSEAMIRIKVYERKTGRKHILYIGRTPEKGILLDSYKGKNEVPVPVKTIVHSYKEDDLIQLSFPCFDCSYCEVPKQKRIQQKRRKAWQSMMIDKVVEALADYENRDYITVINHEHKRWSTIINYYNHPLSSKYQLLPISESEEWEKYTKEYELQQMIYEKRDRSKDDKSLRVELPNDYVYIPSGKLKSIAKTGGEETTIQGFHMSETEVTNEQYRDFLMAMERRGEVELLNKVRVHNENWVTKNGYNEPFVNTYHLHPAYNKYPVINISHEGAKAYCQWMTELYSDANKNNSSWHVEFRLPTKEEWMYAARGGKELAYYPWGGYNVRNAKGCYLGNFKQIDESKLIFDSKTNTFAMADSIVTMTGNSINGAYKYIDGQSLAIVDAYFPNNYGLYNMSGNAAEMLQEKGSTKGGSWNSTGYHVRIDAEDQYAGWEEPNPYIGFRPIVVVRKK